MTPPIHHSKDMGYANGKLKRKDELVQVYAKRRIMDTS
jgi:hypothetical protein